MPDALGTAMDTYDLQQVNAAKAPADPVGDAMDAYDKSQASRLRGNLSQSVGTNPAQYAGQRHDAQTLGVPTSVVAAMPSLQEQAQVQRIDTGTQDAPALRRAYTDADFARLAHDDHGTLAAIEHALRYAVGALPTETLPNGTRVSELDQPSAAGDVLRSLHSFGLKLNKPLWLAGATLPEGYDKLSSLVTGKDTTTAGDWYFDRTVAPIDRGLARDALPADAPFSRKAVSAVGELAGTLAAAYASGGGSAAAEAPAAVQTTGAFLRGLFVHSAKSFAPMATADAVQTYQDVYTQTGDANQAAKAAAAQYSVTTLGAMAPLSAEGALLTRLGTGFVGGVLSGEASRRAMNTVLPAGMRSEFNVDDSTLSGLMGMGLAGALGPRAAPSFHDAIRQTYVDSALADQAQQSAVHLQGLSELATLSKLRDRDGAAFKKLLAEMASDPDALKAVYANANDLAAALHQGGVSPEDLARKMPGVAEQLGQAQATGGDVRIPIEDYATHIAGSPAEAALTPHLKVDPDGMSFKEAAAHFEQQSAGLKDQAAQLAGQVDKEDQHDTELQGIHDTVLGQLDGTGRYRPEVSKAYAALTRDYYGATAERAGMTPAELFAAHPLHVAAENVAAGERLGQDETPRGTYTPSTGTITALHGADLSTFLHELGHHFFETHARIAARENAPTGIKADLQAFLDHVGEKSTPAEFAAKPLDERRAAHESFARSFEAYLMEGKAPSMAQQGLFSRFRSWLLHVYRSMASLRVNLTPEVRAVMDRMLASDHLIHEAERTRGLLAMPKPEGASEKTFEAYLAAGADATAKARSDMDARSLRDMRWLSNTKNKALKELQAASKDARKGIEEQVGATVRELPVYKAKAYLDAHTAHTANSKTAVAAHTAERAKVRRETEVAVKAETLATTDAKGLAKGQFLAKNKRAMANEVDRRMIAWDAAHGAPKLARNSVEMDMVAEQHGFTNGDEMLRAIHEAGPIKEAIEGLTDQRMLEEHGDLVDPVSIERAAEASIHNEARARFMATGLKMLTDSPSSPTELAKAAKDAADAAINGKIVKEVAPKQYAAAERRANRELLKLAPKDTEGAVKAQREALLNHQLFRSALEAQADVAKGLTYLKRFDRDSVRGKLDLDIRDQIDQLLDRFDFRKIPTDAPTRPELNLRDWISAQQDAGYAPSVSPEALDPTAREHYSALRVEQFRGLIDSVKALEQVGRERQLITIEGRHIELDDFVKNDLVPKIMERGERFTPDEILDTPEERFTNPFRVKLAQLGEWLRSARADLKPTEFKRNEFDRHELLGPFGKVFDRVIEANYRKVDLLKGLSLDFERVADGLGREWQDSLREAVERVTLPDPDKGGRPMKLTRGRMIGIAIHVGNESNFDKLTKGWGWDPAVTLHFLKQNMSAKDWHAVQSVWDLYEKHWPETQAMYRRLGQTIPDKIEARPFTVRSPDGAEVNLRGGYAAISYDPLRSRRGARQASAAAIDPGSELNTAAYFKRSTPTNGSMNARIEGYTDRVDLDFHNIARKLNETTHDLAYREALIDTKKVFDHPEFRKAFMSAYGRESYTSLDQWLGTIANADAQDAAVRSLGKFLSYTRTGMVINAIAFRATTVLKHGGSAGFKSLGYFAGGGEKYLAARAALIGSDYRAQIAGAQAKFAEIRARLMQQDRDFKVTSRALFERDSALSQAERMGHAAVAWADMLTAVPTAWAAYDRAIGEGIPISQGGTGAPMTEAQAVAYANKIVREAHGSNIETARSNVMNTRDEAVKMFTTLFGFMNTTYGQQVDAFDKLRTAGISNTPVLARTLMAIVVPALWASLLNHGTPDKKKGEGWAAWVGKAIAGEVASSVPFVRDAVSMFEGYSHAGQVAAESWLATMVQASHDIATIGDKGTHGAPVKDVANALGQGLHIPGLGQLGTSLQYLEDLHTGKAHADNPWDFAKGLVTGHDATH